MPGTLGELMMDTKMLEMKGGFDYKGTAAKAVAGTITKLEEEDILKAFKWNPELALECGIGHDKIKELVEKNANFAVEYLIALSLCSKSLDQYYEAIFAMPLDSNLLNIIFKLQEKASVPSEFYRQLIVKELENCSVVRVNI